MCIIYTNQILILFTILKNMYIFIKLNTMLFPNVFKEAIAVETRKYYTSLFQK